MVTEKCGAVDRDTCRYHGVGGYLDRLKREVEKRSENRPPVLNKFMRSLKLDQLEVWVHQKTNEPLEGVICESKPRRPTAPTAPAGSASFVEVPLTPSGGFLSLKDRAAFKTRADEQYAALKESILSKPDDQVLLRGAFVGQGMQLNRVLRGGGAPNGDLAKLDSLLTTVFDKVPSNGQEALTFRGERFHADLKGLRGYLNGMKDTNGHVVFPEYLRTTPEMKRGFSFTNADGADGSYGVLYQIISKKGLYSGDDISYASQEHEVLFNKNSKFEVVKIEDVPIVDYGTAGKTKPFGVVYLREV